MDYLVKHFTCQKPYIKLFEHRLHSVNYCKILNLRSVLSTVGCCSHKYSIYLYTACSCSFILQVQEMSFLACSCYFKEYKRTKWKTKWN